MHFKQHLYYGSLNLYSSVFYTSHGPNQLLNPLMPTNKFSKRFSAHFVQYEQGEFFVLFLVQKTLFERDSRVKVFRMQAHFH